MNRMGLESLCPSIETNVSGRLCPSNCCRDRRVVEIGASVTL